MLQLIILIFYFAMDAVSTPVIIFIVSQLITGAAIYGAIRSDLKHMHERQREDRESTKKAHERIDQLFQAYWQNKTSQ